MNEYIAEASIVTDRPASTIDGNRNVTQLMIQSGLHKGLVADLSNDTYTVGADQDADLVLIDLADVELVFEREEDQSWYVHSTGGDLQLDGIASSNYERHQISHKVKISCNGIQMQLLSSRAKENKKLKDTLHEKPLVASAAILGQEIAARNQNRTKRGLILGGILAGALGVGVSTLLHLNATSIITYEGAKSLAISPSSAKIAALSDQSASRDQITDFINAQRLPVTVQGISADSVRLIWSGADAIPARTQRLIGDEIFGREVRWVQASTALSTEEPHLSPAKRAQRAAIDRGNQKTEETLRNLGLADIAQVQAKSIRGSAGRFILTRSGHRVFEGSDLRSGAQLKVISAEEMTVLSNGTVMIVPYDVAKPVKKIASALTVVNTEVGSFGSAQQKSGKNTSDKCDLKHLESAGTVVATCNLRMSQVSAKANETNQTVAVNPINHAQKIGTPQIVNH